MADYLEMLNHLKVAIRELESVVVAFSGGVDSGFLAVVANEVLGEKAVALTAVSASHPARELADARDLAARMGFRHVQRPSGEIQDPRYAANPTDRCYWCKTHVFDVCRRFADEIGFAHVVDGLNSDDLGDFRPGRKAAAEAGVRSPLAEVGMDKAAIRALLRDVYELELADKPASPCLASRFPYGTEVTAERLAQVEAVEEAARALGLRDVRARFHGDIVRLELPAGEFATLVDPAVRSEMARAVRQAGFRYGTLDLEPFRSGRLNDSIAEMAQGAGVEGGEGL